MRLINTFKLANNIEGSFVEAGFGRGETTKQVFKAMNNSTILKRDSYLIDSFKGMSIPTPVDLSYDSRLHEGKDPGRLQVAMDLRYELGNHFSVTVLECFIEPYLISLYKGGPIACLHIDLPSFSATTKTLEIFQPFMAKEGIVYISGYGDSLGITNAVDTFLEDNKLQYQLIKNGPYLINKLAPVSFTKPQFSRPLLQTEVTIPVSRPKVVSFADRYIKPALSKFIPKSTILDNVTNILKKVAKDFSTPEDIIPISKEKVKPFKNRYVKKETPKFKPKKVIKEGLNVINKKVTR
tara:strand:+ start:151 stop:1035 length:885 start_codon:yes stop_codon:yes gene_type:complete